MALTQITMKWDARPYIEEVRRALNEVVKEGAQATAEDAKKILERHVKKKIFFSEETKSTGNLASEIDIRASQFKDGGWIVEAQGRGNYTKFYASFVELGTSKMAAIPYLRPALRRNRYRMRRLFEQKLGAVVR